MDCTIKKILKTGYCNHIERLMILGNFMLLCEFDPNEFINGLWNFSLILMIGSWCQMYMV